MEIFMTYTKPDESSVGEKITREIAKSEAEIFARVEWEASGANWRRVKREGRKAREAA